MIKRIVVWSRREIEENPTDKFTHVVSIIDPNKPLDLKRENVSQHTFHDLEEDYEGYILPSREIVQKIIDNFKSVHAQEDDTSFIVHCTAGISRSSAAALMGIYIACGGDEKKALGLLLSMKQSIWPNALMLKYADEILGTKLAAEVEKWKQNVRKKGEIVASQIQFN